MIPLAVRRSSRIIPVCFGVLRLVSAGCGGPVAPLIADLKGPNPSVRRNALGALGALGDPSAAEPQFIIRSWGGNSDHALA